MDYPGGTTTLQRLWLVWDAMLSTFCLRCVPQLLRIYDPDVPGWFGWFSLLGIVWIYIVQFRLYKTVNALYREAGMKEPLVIWWIFVPGLNLIVGLRQIHFLSQYWASKQEMIVKDAIAETIPFLSVNV